MTNSSQTECTAEDSAFVYRLGFDRSDVFEDRRTTAHTNGSLGQNAQGIKAS